MITKTFTFTLRTPSFDIPWANIQHRKGRQDKKRGKLFTKLIREITVAAKKAEDMAKTQGLYEIPTRGSALASDAFFPFADGLEAAIEAGASSIIQPGGSIRDDEVIKVANDAGLAMIFTGMRHFKH